MFRRTPFIRTQHNLHILGIIPFIKLQNNTWTTVQWWKMRWKAKLFICFSFFCSHTQSIKPSKWLNITMQYYIIPVDCLNSITEICLIFCLQLQFLDEKDQAGILIKIRKIKNKMIYIFFNLKLYKNVVKCTGFVYIRKYYIKDVCYYLHEKQLKKIDPKTHKRLKRTALTMWQYNKICKFGADYSEWGNKQLGHSDNGENELVKTWPVLHGRKMYNQIFWKMMMIINVIISINTITEKYL